MNIKNLRKNKGWTFYLDGWQETDGATSYYQAFGSRSNATGAFSAVNNFGYYWTGTPVGSSGGYLYMSGGGLYPSQGAYRSNGFAVRPGTYE